jgi:hypothetical protein
MQQGIERFDYFLQQLQTLISKAAQQENPALWLYHNNARTPLFMLEALSKLYIDLHNKKKFTKLKAHFKLLEDALGAIDYYDSLAKELSTNKKIPANIVAFLQAQSSEKIQSLNELLIEKKWIGSEDTRIKKIAEKLAEADWLSPEKEMEAIADFYGKAIYEIIEFTQQNTYNFSNMEEQVHELRRKLRWLSIYPQALRGCVQLSTPTSTPKHLTKYLTKAITTSPFNKMPAMADCNEVLLLDKKYFFALSWMIAELGTLKDKGLKIMAIKEAIQQSTTKKDVAAFKETYTLIGAKEKKLPALLLTASQVAKSFFKEQNLEHLVIGLRKIP